jgi:hypothetical protein
MTADEFARQLAGYLHIPIELKEDKDLIDASARTGNALIDFVRAYDTSKIEIGMITFPPWPLKTKRGWHVGYEEVDPILLDSETGEVWLKEYGEDHIVGYCAKDSDRFLEALLAVVRLVSESEARGESNKEFNRRGAAQTCAAVAGGDRYYSFYRSVFAAR